MIKVFSIGELLWDNYGDKKITGGAPLNFAFYASQLGAESSAVTTVGNDDSGQELLKMADSYGIDLECTIVDKPTGEVKITFDAQGEALYQFNSDCAWDHIPFNQKACELSGNADLIVFGTLAQRNDVSKKTILSCLENKKDSAKVLLDVNLRQNFYTKEIIEKSLQQADFLKLNEDECKVLQTMFGKKLVDIHDSFGLEFTMLTKGAKGSTLIDPYGEYDSPSYAEKVVDPIGAGDAFAAACILAYLEDQNTMLAHDKASQVAAYVCSQKGAAVKL